MNPIQLVGREAWIDCEVKPGPFSDERMVRVKSNGTTWVGFTHTEQLHSPVPEQGPSKIKIRLLDFADGRFTAKVLGYAVTSQAIQVTLGEVQVFDSQQAGNRPLS